MTRRIENDDTRRGAALTLNVDGQAVAAHAGETVATVLLAQGITAFNRTGSGQPRGPWCNMGTCYECQVRVREPGSGPERWRRACLCRVSEGMSVRTGVRLQSAGGGDADEN
ncbi:(2Fe-2S)-binding protein [Elongatibacter sediminis]|uniref:(2Fe-2S)-binding protein n=1 Tax=Elongatibacter sediminis TaxID=3119006 RepID=A0AAW9R669_9GAMM